MSKFLYLLYGGIILIGSTLANINYASGNVSAGRGWLYFGGGTSWGGANGSTGGFSSGGSHK